VVLGNRAYLVQFGSGGANGTLMVYDVSDPANPTLLDSSQSLWPRPVDIAGTVDNTGVLSSPGNLIAVAAGPLASSVPSNVYLFDASTDHPTWIGATSLTSSAEDGFINRLVLRKGFGYSLTFRKGIQVIDLHQVTQEFPVLYSTAYWQMLQALHTDGQGFAQDAVIQSIPTNLADGTPAHLYDMKVNDFTDPSGQVHTLALATGWDINLAIAEPATGSESNYAIKMTDAQTQKISSLSYGAALDTGTIGTTPVAVVGGYGSILGGPQVIVLAVENMTDPANPTPLSIFPLSGFAGGIPAGNGITDVVLTSSGMALVATNTEVVLVNLTDPRRPVFAGTLGPDANGLPQAGGRLALGTGDLNGLLFSTAYSRFGGSSDPLGGIHDVALGPLAFFKSVTPEPFGVPNNKNAVPIAMLVDLVPPNYSEVQKAEVDLYQDGNQVATLPLTFHSPGQATLPAGFVFNVNSLYEVQAVIDKGIQGKERTSAKHALLPVQVGFRGRPQVPDDDGAPITAIPLYEARPRVIIDAVNIPGGSLTGTIQGRVLDDLAPVMGSVFVNGLGSSISNTPPNDNGPVGGFGPWEGSFAANLVPLMGPSSGPRLPDPSKARVVYGNEGALVAATATNAVGNVGWAGAFLDPVVDANGTPQSVESRVMQSLPPVPASTFGSRELVHSFWIEAKDSVSMKRGAPFVIARVHTSVEDKVVKLVPWKDTNGAPVFRSQLLYLVPATFALPSGLTAQQQQDIGGTRIRATKGERIQVTYVVPDANDSAISTGVTLVDANGSPLTFVPAQLPTPAVVINQITPVITALGGEDLPNVGTASVVGTILDPVAAVFRTQQTAPSVQVNGVTPSGDPVAGAAPGQYTFSVSGVPLVGETLVHARAVGISGAVGQASRDVTIHEDSSIDVAPSLVLVQPPALAKFQVKVFGPKLDPSTITGQELGLYSYAFPAGQLPPTISLDFVEKGTPANGVHTYLSNEIVVPVQVPSHQLKSPQTPSTLGGAPLLAVEVGGFADTSLTLGAAGALDSLTDVSGFEIVTPRDGSLVNVRNTLGPSSVAALAPAFTLTIKARGVSPPASIYLTQPAVVDLRGAPLVQIVPSLFSGLDPSSIVSTASLIGSLDANLLLASTSDASGNSFNSSSGFFLFKPEGVANFREISPFNTADLNGMWIGSGRLYSPELYDGVELLYDQGISDTQISEHLRVNGLRVDSLKRNGGTLVTATRSDGRSGFEPLTEDFYSRVVSPSSFPIPLPGVVMDGDEITWQDIVDVGQDQAYLNTYASIFPYPLNGLPTPVGMWQRSAILQLVRERLGMPQRMLGVSAESLRFIDGEARDIAQNILTEGFGKFLPLVVGMAALPETRGVVETVENSESIGSSTVVQAGLTDATGNAIANVIDQTLIVRPTLDGNAKMFKWTSQGLSEAAPVLAAKRVNQPIFKDYGFDAGGPGTVAYNAGNVASQTLGELATVDFATNPLGLAADAGVDPRSLASVCCEAFNFPGSGGGATSKFDKIVARYPLNPDGTRNLAAGPLDYFVLESKGHWANIVSKGKGRNILLPSGQTRTALQGTKPYVDDVLLAMSNDASIDPRAQALAQEIVQRSQSGQSQIHCYFVQARFIVKGRVVQDISPLYKVSKVLLR
jgi:hypothetical protein